MPNNLGTLTVKDWIAENGDDGVYIELQFTPTNSSNEVRSNWMQSVSTNWIYNEENTNPENIRNEKK